MKKLLIAFAAAVLVLSACKKEPSFENSGNNPGGGNTGGNSGTVLVRMGNRVGDDTLTSDFTYNANGRLTLVSHTGLVSGQPIELQQIFRRNAADVITKTVLRSQFFLANGFETDSLVTVHEYDAASGHYLRSVSHFVLDNDPQSDSAVYEYDAAGRIATITTYFGDNSGYVPEAKAEYAYAGNNLSSVKSYSANGSSFVLEETETYEYDNKVNPQQAVADAPILGIGDFYSANNKTKRTTVTENPQETIVTNVAYSYNSNNRPIKANGSAAGSTSITSYFYQ